MIGTWLINGTNNKVKNKMTTPLTLQVANEFDRLLTNTTQVFETSTLLTKESKAFGNIYHNKALFTLEFRDEKVLSIILMMCQRRDLKLHGKN